MLHRDADARDSDPAAEAHENRLAASLDQLYDIGIHADSRHRHNDKELGQRLERRKHACRYADRGAHRGDDGREHEVQDKHRERALEREGFAALALLGLGLVPRRSGCRYGRGIVDRRARKQAEAVVSHAEHAAERREGQRRDDVEQKNNRNRLRDLLIVRADNRSGCRDR